MKLYLSLHSRSALGPHDQRQDSKNGSTVYYCFMLARVLLCIACVSFGLQFCVGDAALHCLQAVKVAAAVGYLQELKDIHRYMPSY